MLGIIACLFLLIQIYLFPEQIVWYAAAVVFTALMNAFAQRITMLKAQTALRQRLALERLAERPIADVDQQQAEQPVPALSHLIRRSLWIALIAGPGMAVVTSLIMHGATQLRFQLLLSDGVNGQNPPMIWSLAVPLFVTLWLVTARLLLWLGGKLADARQGDERADLPLPSASPEAESVQFRPSWVVRFFTLGGGLVAVFGVPIVILIITALLPVNAAVRNGLSGLLTVGYFGVVIYLYARGPLSPRQQLRRMAEQVAEHEPNPVRRAQIEAEIKTAERTLEQHGRTLEVRTQKRGGMIGFGLMVVILVGSIGLSRFARAQGADDSTTTLLLIGGVIVGTLIVLPMAVWLERRFSPPSIGLALYAQIEPLIKAGRFDEAQAIVAPALQQLDNWETRSVALIVAFQANRLEEAEIHAEAIRAEAATGIIPENQPMKGVILSVALLYEASLALLLDQTDRAEAVVERLKALKLENDQNTGKLQAQMRLLRGDPTAALALLQQIEPQFKTPDGELLALKAWALDGLGKRAEADAMMKAAIEAVPPSYTSELAAVYLLEARLLQGRGETGAMQSALMRAQALDPNGIIGMAARRQLEAIG